MGDEDQPRMSGALVRQTEEIGHVLGDHTTVVTRRPGEYVLVGLRGEPDLDVQYGDRVMTRVPELLGPLSGKWFRSPSGAAKAVVEVLNPGVSPNRSGFDFWFVTETGKTLQSIRSRR